MWRSSRDCGRYVEARLLAVREPSPARVEPDCPVFGRCGGCQARHMTYAETLRLKRQRVVDALTRIGGIDAPERAGNAAHARDRCAAATRRNTPSPGARSALCAPAAARSCPSRLPFAAGGERARPRQLAKMDLRGLRGAVTRVNRRGEVMLTLCGTGKEPPIRDFPGVDSLYYCRLKPRPAHALDGECRLLAGAERLEETLFGLRFSLLPQSFFQVNAAQAERMYAVALDALELKAGESVLDAYCGAGTITLLAAARGAQATGVELVRPAVLDARANASRNGLGHAARFLLGDAAQEIPRLVRAGERFRRRHPRPAAPRRGRARAGSAPASRPRAHRLHLLRPRHPCQRPQGA